MLIRFAFAVLLLIAVVPALPAAEPADLIVHSGKVVTVNGRFDVAQAMAVRGGRIVAVGNDAEVMVHKGDGSVVVDLAGKMVLPGLIDSHVHPASASMHEFDHPIPAMESIADVLAYVRERAKVVPEGEWITLRQVFITRLKEQRYPSRAELDEAAPKHLVAFATGPDASVSSLVLKKFGIDRDFKETGAGKIERDASGEPTGIIRSAGRYAQIGSSPSKKVTQADRDGRLKELFADYNRYGITGVIDRNCSLEGQEQYLRLKEAGQLSVRVRMSRALDANRSLEAVVADLDKIAADPAFTSKDPQAAILGVKIFLDGGMLTGSAYMREPWGVSQIYGIDDNMYRGLLYVQPEVLVPVVKACAERGLAFTAHSVGDGAIHALLSAYDEVNRTTPIGPTRSSLTHSNFMSREAVEMCARLKVPVDIQPAWLYLDTRTLVRQFGQERLRYFQPLKSLFEAGAIAGGGSDHMQRIGAIDSVNPYHPFLAMWVALTRQAKWYEGQLHSEEALSREQVIRFYTWNNAYLMKLEDQIGSLEVGKRADFVVVDRDLLTCPVDEVRDTQVLATYLNGRPVFERPKGTGGAN
jgi:predicted amidohydrolase YtcJ